MWPRNESGIEWRLGNLRLSASLLVLAVLGASCTGSPPVSTPLSRPSSTPWPTPDTSRCGKPTDIAGDGRTDVTAALQRFLDRVPNGSCAVLPATSRGRPTRYR